MDDEFIMVDGHIVNKEEYAIREAMRALGRRKSQRKTLACRANARKSRKRKIIGVKPTESTLAEDASRVV